MLTPWKYKSGVELTFQRSFEEVSSFQRWSERQYFGRRNCLHADCLRMSRAVPKELVWSVTTDPDCVEVPTRILVSWSDAEQVINTILEHAKKKKLIAKNKGLSTGGGGHVHVSGMNDLTKCAVVRDMQNRPYVPWFFADPDTTSQCNSVHSEGFGLLSAGWKTIRNDPRDYIWNGKFTHVHIHTQGTLEFRFFDCFMEYERYEESLAFAQAYVKWIADSLIRNKRFNVLIKNRSGLLAHYNDYVRCLEEFQKLIETIGLPWARYKRYIDNLDQRFEDINLLR